MAKRAATKRSDSGGSRHPGAKAPDLVRELRDQILDGTYRYDEPLPSFHELEARFATSRATIDKTLGRLSELGLIRREHGRGVFALAPDERRGPIDVCCGQDPDHLVDSSFFWHIFCGITARALDRDRDVRLLTSLVSRSLDELRKDLPARMLERATLGLIVFGVYADELFLVLRDTGLPVICVDFDAAHLGLDCVVTDTESDARSLTSFVRSQGHDEVALILPPSDDRGGFRDPDHGRRRDGFLTTMRDAGVTAPERLVLHHGGTDEDGTLGDDGDLGEALAALKPDAVISDFGDLERLRRIATRHKLRWQHAVFNSLGMVPERGVPRDLITTDYDFAEAGRASVEVLFERLEQGRGRAIRRTIPMQLAVGGKRVG